MGFDLSGINPQINKPETEYKYYREDSKIWQSEDEHKRNKYFEEMDEYHKANPGVYFRNNVWWWRPLWDFVCFYCQDIMTKDDMDAGNWNDGKEINQETAAKIGTKLKILLEDGSVDMYEKEYKSKIENLKSSSLEEKNWQANYPFSKDNVSNFADFCLESGGFVIC